MNEAVLTELKTSEGLPTLRDQFAMRALPVVLDKLFFSPGQSVAQIARYAYSVADAMLAAREETSNG